MSMKVSDVIGVDRLRAMRAEGKDNAAILAEANTLINPVRESIGADVYEGFKSQGIPFYKMKEYADYVVKQSAEKAKAAEDKAYQSEVKARKDDFMKPDISYVDALEGTTKPVGKDPEFINEQEKDGATFTDALVNNQARLASFINPLNPFTGDKVDPYWAGVIEAMPELEKKYKEGRLSPEDYAQYIQDQKNTENAEGIWDTLGEVGKDMYHRLQNPSAINFSAAAGEMITPENFVAGPVGGALAKVGTKVGTKLLSGAAAGIAADTTANYGYEYGVQKGLGANSEDAHKGAAVQALAGVVPGAVMGAGGAGVRIMGKVKALEAPASLDTDPNNPNQPTQTLEMNPGTVLPGGGDSPSPSAPKNVELPDTESIQQLLALEKSAKDTDVRVGKIAEISKTITDPVEKAKTIAKEAPASVEEHLTSYTLNAGSPVSDRLAGFAHIDALEKSIIENQKTPQEIYYTLDQEGFRGVNLNKMVEAYVKKDINIYENWAAAKLNNSAKGEADARANAGNGREDTTVQTDRANSSDAGSRETTDPNAKPETIPGLKPRDTENLTTTGRDTGNLDPETELPLKNERVDGQPAVRSDDGTVPGNRRDNLVQNEDGVSVDAEVETPLSRAGEVHVVNAEKFDSFAVDAPTETNIPKFMLDFKEPIKTPIGEFKIDTDYLLNKAMDRDSGLRANELHLIKPTLTDPAYVVSYRGAYHFIKPFIEDGKVKKYLSVISDKKGNVQFVTAHKMKGNGYKKILDGGDVVVDNVEGRLLRAGAKSTESRNLKPATLPEQKPKPRRSSKNSIAKNNINVKDVKTRDQLLSHRYYDDVLKSVRRSDNPSKYTSAQIESLKNKKLGDKLATKFREDMRTYAKDPKYAKQRSKTDAKFRELNDTAEVLSQMKLDDALDLVESDSFKKAFEKPMNVNDMAKGADDLLVDVNKKVDEAFSELDPLLIGDEKIKLSDVYEVTLSNVKDPLKRVKMRKEFERTSLKDDKVKLAEWEKKNLDKDGNIKERGDC